MAKKRGIPVLLWGRGKKAWGRHFYGGVKRLFSRYLLSSLYLKRRFQVILVSSLPDSNRTRVHTRWGSL